MPGQFEWGANVVKAISAAYRTPVHDADRWRCELDWMVDGVILICLPMGRHQARFLTRFVDLVIDRQDGIILELDGGRVA